MRIRALIGWVLSFGILTVSGFLIFVGITSSVNTQPMSLIPSLLGLGVGLFLCIRVPDNNIGPVVLVAVLSFTVVGAYALVRDWGVANGHPLFAMIAEIAGEMAFSGLLTALLILLPIWFPDGVAISRWSGWVARAAMFFMLLAFLGVVFQNRVCVVWVGGGTCSRYVANPWGIPGPDGSVLETLNVGLFLLTIPAVIAAVLRWRRSTGVQRAQLKWFTLAAVPFVADFLFTVLNLRFIGTDLAAWALAVTLSGVWLSIGFAVAKYRLYDIDRIISRTVGYALVIVALGSVYVVGAVWLPIRLMGEQPPLFVAGSTLVVAALFNPLRRRLLVWVDRRFYRSQYDAQRVVDRFGDHLREGTDVNQLIGEAVAVVGEAMRPSAVGVWVHDHTE
ncbi:MAG: hypothetical protein WB239_14190 [Acidimicrobiia bacterium]